MNNREIAAVVWIGGMLLWAIVALPDFRRALVAVLKNLATPKLALPLLAMFTYIVGLVYAGSLVGLWDPALASDTVAWFIATGVGLFGASVSVFKRGSSLRTVLLAALGITVFVEVFVNLYVFPLVVELLLTPILAFLVVMSVVAGTEDSFAAVKKVTDGLLAVIGLALILIVAIELVNGWDEFEQTEGWQRFALPVWLTLAAMPIVGLLGVYAVYDTAFAMVRWASEDPRRRWRARIALVTGLHVRARDVADINGVWCKELTAASSLAEARAVVRRFRQRELGRVAPPVG